jgi:hypothetical protein
MEPYAGGALLCETALQLGFKWRNELDQVRGSLRRAGVSLEYRLLVTRDGTRMCDGDGNINGSMLRGALHDIDFFLVPNPRLATVNVAVPLRYAYDRRPTTLDLPILCHKSIQHLLRLVGHKARFSPDTIRLRFLGAKSDKPSLDNLAQPVP